MPHPRRYCLVCGRPCRSESGYCIEHSPTLGKYVRTEKHKELMRQKMLGRDVYWIKGIKRPEHSEYLKQWWLDHPEEIEKARIRGIERVSDKAYLNKLSDAFRGENNPNWRGGQSQKPYKHFYKKLKLVIRTRDNYTCQLCGKTEHELGYTLSIHHIDFDKGNTNETNLITLCKSCNSKVNFGRGWIQFFQNKIAFIYGFGERKIELGNVLNVV